MRQFACTEILVLQLGVLSAHAFVPVWVPPKYTEDHFELLCRLHQTSQLHRYSINMSLLCILNVLPDKVNRYIAIADILAVHKRQQDKESLDQFVSVVFVLFGVQPLCDSQSNVVEHKCFLPSPVKQPA